MLARFPRLRHQDRLTDWFCLFGLMAFFATDSLAPLISYFVFQVLGISIGLHRVAGHGEQVYKPFERLFFVLGLLTHAGPLKGSALDHARHHRYADTDSDPGRVQGIPFLHVLDKLEIRIILRRFDWFAQALDKYYYAWFVPMWIALIAIDPGILTGAAIATAIHTWAVGYLHRGKGYRNFNTDDTSANNIWFWPLFLGENWHNNHHATERSNYQVKWWELDLVYWILRPFRCKS